MARSRAAYRRQGGIRGRVRGGGRGQAECGPRAPAGAAACRPASKGRTARIGGMRWAPSRPVMAQGARSRPPPPIAPDGQAGTYHGLHNVPRRCDIHRGWPAGRGRRGGTIGGLPRPPPARRVGAGRGRQPALHEKKRKMCVSRYFDESLAFPPDDFPVLGLYAGFWGLYESAFFGCSFVMPLRGPLHAISLGRCAACHAGSGLHAGTVLRAGHAPCGRRQDAASQGARGGGIGKGGAGGGGRGGRRAGRAAGAGAPLLSATRPACLPARAHRGGGAFARALHGGTGRGAATPCCAGLALLRRARPACIRPRAFGRRSRSLGRMPAVALQGLCNGKQDTAQGRPA